MENTKILGDYFNYLEVMQMSKVYYNSLKVFFQEYLIPNKVLITDIKREHLTEYLANKKYSANSFNTFIKAGRHLFTHFLEIEDSAFKKIKLLKVEKKIPDYINEEELRHGVKYAIVTMERYSTKKIIALLYFMFYSGLRKGEILNLTRADFSLEKRPIEVKVRVPTKGKHERIVYLPPKLRVMLYKYFNSEEEKGNAFNLCASGLDYLVKIFADSLPDKKISVHTFRHSYAKSLIKKGVDVTIVSKLLGHKNIETTLIYVDPEEEMIRDIYKKKMIGN